MKDFLVGFFIVPYIFVTTGLYIYLIFGKTLPTGNFHFGIVVFAAIAVCLIVFLAANTRIIP